MSIKKSFLVATALSLIMAFTPITAMAMSMKELAALPEPQQVEVLKQNYVPVAKELIIMLRSDVDSKGVPKSKERLARDNARADIIQKLEESMDAKEQLFDRIGEVAEKSPDTDVKDFIKGFFADKVRQVELEQQRAKHSDKGSPRP